MKIVYFGTGDFAVPALDRVKEHVSLVVCQPARPFGRKGELKLSPVELYAREASLPVAAPEKARDPEFIARVRDLAPDLLLVASYGQILRPALLDAARVAPINLHGSILPRWRGAAPIQRAIEAGDEETGITLMKMDPGMDTGPIIDISRTPIGQDETAGELSARLAEIAADLAEAWLPRLAAGEFEALDQTDGATIAPKLTKEDGEIRLTMAATDAYNRYRAFAPAPGSRLVFAEGTLKLHRVAMESAAGTELAPGELKLLSDRVLVGFADGALALFEVQPEGRKRISARDWANGARLSTGSLLSPEIGSDR